MPGQVEPQAIAQPVIGDNLMTLDAKSAAPERKRRLLKGLATIYMTDGGDHARDSPSSRWPESR
jgi:hypothetical protein